ncbi:MAG TPA: sugar kinase [Bacteroidales bacterium]|nr:sugar kinase [Bacteroidales bacterium]
MNINLRSDYRWALVAPTSMGVRLTPVNGQPVHCSDTYFMQATSAESNVLSITSCLGLPVKVLTVFVKDSPVARFIKDSLGSRNIRFDAREIEQGGPWGYRHQFNIADSGSGPRGPRVHNDRAGEAGREMEAGDFDLTSLLSEEGAGIIHISGLVAALSPGTGNLCLELARAARMNDTRISFDLNYRASFWKGREKELSLIFTEIASLSDILSGNEEDFQLCLGIKGPETGGKDLNGKITGFRTMILEARKAFPGVSCFSTTLREVIDSGEHLWGAIMFNGDNFYQVEPRKIRVLDRIGGGDGFIGGLLYGILKGWEPEKCLRFGWASGALATSLLTDYAIPADEDQVWSIWEGNARIKR